MATATRNIELVPLATRAGGSRVTAQVAGIADHDRLTLFSRYDERLTDAKASVDEATRIIIEVNQRGVWVPFGGYSWRGGALAADLIAAMGSANPSISIVIPPEFRGLDFRFHQDAIKGTATKLDLRTEFSDAKQIIGIGPRSVAYDSSGNTTFANVSSASYTHTFSGTPTGCAVFAMTGQYPVADSTVSSVTVNGSSATNEGSDVAISANLSIPIRSTAFTRASPSTGTVATTFAAGGHYGAVGSIGVVGGDTSDVADGFTSGTGTTSGNPSVTVTSNTSDLVLDGLASYDNPSPPSATAGSGQTDRINVTSAGVRGSVSEEAGASSVTMSWTLGASAGYRAWAQVALNMRQAPAAGLGIPIAAYHYNHHLGSMA